MTLPVWLYAAVPIYHEWIFTWGSMNSQNYCKRFTLKKRLKTV